MNISILKIQQKSLSDQFNNLNVEKNNLNAQINNLNAQIGSFVTKIARLEKEVERYSEDKYSYFKQSKALNKPDELKVLKVNIFFTYIFVSKNQFIF